MYVLGIETSCDETAASVVKDGNLVLSNIFSSSLNFHKRYGGIVPEIAFRMQLETITQVTEEAIVKSGVKLNKIGLISVTDGPGLFGSLVTGLSYAKASSLGLGIPILGVNHLYSHIFASFLNKNVCKFPFVALLVSGGHTVLFYVRSFGQIEALGSTLDDACGEAFDKVAKILRLGYPGGPLIEKISKRGNFKKIKFACSNTQKLLDFSFSGIKTGVLYYVKDLVAKRKKNLKPTQTCDIAASFQKSVFDALIYKSILACKIKKAKQLVVGGGVAANNVLREGLRKSSELKGIDCIFPEKAFCADNAAMVAGLGYHLFSRGYKSGLDLDVEV